MRCALSEATARCGRWIVRCAGSALCLFHPHAPVALLDRLRHTQPGAVQVYVTPFQRKDFLPPHAGHRRQLDDHPEVRIIEGGQQRRKFLVAVLAGFDVRVDLGLGDLLVDEILSVVFELLTQ